MYLVIEASCIVVSIRKCSEERKFVCRTVYDEP